MTARGAAVLLLAAVVAAGCSLGDRQKVADRIAAAAGAAERERTMAGSIDVTVEPVRSRRPPPPGPPRILPVQVRALPFESDLAAGTTLVGRVAGGPALVFDGSVVYQRRGSIPANLQGAGSAAATNLLILEGAGDEAGDGAGAGSPRRGRQWVKLDFDRVPRRANDQVAGSLGIDPSDLVRLLRGTLAGSVRVVGADDLSGTSTTHYAINVSRDKAGRELDGRERIRLEKVFRANAVESDSNKAEVWLDADGRARRLVVRLRQRLDSAARADLVVTIDVDRYGMAVTGKAPERREVATVASFGQLVHAATGV